MVVLTAVDAERLARALAAPEFVWVDLTSPDAAALEVLGSALGLHPLAVADTREFGQRPKADRYDDRAALIVAFAARTGTGNCAVPIEVHVHIAPGWLFTAHREPLSELDALHRSVARHPPAPEDAIVVRVLAALAGGLDDAIDRQGAALDELEDLVLEQTRHEQLREVVAFKHAIAALHRRVDGELNVFPDVEQAVFELPELDPAARPYLRDVADHLARAEGRLAAQQAQAAALTDTYFNANANRLTELSERLSVIATILLPLTLVTGFFGQNFGWLVAHIDTLTAFLVFGVGGLTVPPVLALAYLRRRRRTP